MGNFLGLYFFRAFRTCVCLCFLAGNSLNKIFLSKANNSCLVESTYDSLCAIIFAVREFLDETAQPPP